MNEYGGNWITTYTGKQFHFLNPQPDEIDIVDIAHALSLTCRFGGQCSKFYSVAEHSIRAAEIVPNKYKLFALLHDASEAYLPDLPRPIKANLPKFKSMECNILIAIWTKFMPCTWYGNYVSANVPWFEGQPVIKQADNVLLATEARDLMANMDDWALLPKALTDIIYPMTPAKAEELFLVFFEKYSRSK